MKGRVEEKVHITVDNSAMTRNTKSLYVPYSRDSSGITERQKPPTNYFTSCNVQRIEEKETTDLETYDCGGRERPWSRGSPESIILPHCPFTKREDKSSHQPEKCQGLSRAVLISPCIGVKTAIKTASRPWGPMDGWFFQIHREPLMPYLYDELMDVMEAVGRR